MRIALAGLALIVFALPTAAQEGRTFVDRLPLDTPQSTVTAFIEAFAAKDFATAYFMMSPEAKRTFIESYYAYTVGEYFELDGTGFVEGSIFSDTSGLPDGSLDDVLYDSALIFDNIVFHAEANGDLPFDLTDARVVLVEDTEAGGAVATVEGGEPATIKVQTDVLQNGDWRVDRIFWTGSDTGLKPWGIKRSKDK